MNPIGCEAGIVEFMKAVKKLNGARIWVKAKQAKQPTGKTPVPSDERP